MVDGQVIESDGKTRNAQHTLALDPFTLAVLKAHVEMIDQERRDFGPDYDDHGVLFCWENGKALSKRIGHADVAFTMKQYVQTDLEADREVANTLADLIIGGMLVSGIEDQADDNRVG